MTAPPRKIEPTAAATLPVPLAKFTPALLFILLFAVVILLHAPLLALPYYWDEAGHFVPAARDLLYTGDPIPRHTISNAHPPLVMAYLALSWRLLGEGIVVTRVAMLAIAALALLGLFYLARRVAGSTEVAVATVVCTALYPVFFAQSSLAHLDMAAAALTIWGLVCYVPAAREVGEEQRRARAAAFLEPPTRGRLAASVVLFALAALAKETAILTPLALFGWHLVGRFLWSGKGGGGPAKSFALLLLAVVPLTLWFGYHYYRTGYIFGNPEFFRYNVAATLTPARILFAGGVRLWQLTGHMNLFLLTGAAALAMLRNRPLRRADSIERPRIDVGTQLVFAVVIMAHVVALSLIGGAVLARYLLPVIPLVILICVSTLRRRVSRWRLAAGLVCAGFVLGLFVNPSYRFPWEENLSYRDFIELHKGAAGYLAAEFPEARVLTAWPASDELSNPYFGYTDRRFAVVPIEQFSAELLGAAARAGTEYDVALLFSTNYHDDVAPETAAALLGGQIVYRAARHRQWVAVVAKKDATRRGHPASEVP